MDFAFSEEQEMLRAAARDWLADRYPLDRVARLADSRDGWDPESWDELRKLGWLDPELGLLEHAVLAEEAGYALYPGPWLATVGLALPAVGAASLSRPATLAWVDDGAHNLREAAGSVACRADDDVDGWRLTGIKRVVPDAAAAGGVTVVARTSQHVGLFQVDLDANREVVRCLPTLDGTRRLAELHLHDTPAELVSDGADAAAALTRARRHVLALLACEAAGVTHRALDLATDYARTRTQFDRPIGSYQGVSHRLSNVYMTLQLARSLAYRAAWTVAVDDPAADEAVSAATSAAGDAAVDGCENAMQAMGGIGFTWDHPLHRLYKRAQWIKGFEGFPRAHRADLAALLLDG